MKDYNPNEIKMFMFKATAYFYAWRAKRAGYPARVSKVENWIMTGGRYSVSLRTR